MNYFVYIVKCKDKTLYTGYTNNLIKRIKDHNESKKAAKYTRGRRPVKLVYSEVYKSLSDALKREIEIKNLSREKKINLIRKNARKKI